MPAVLVVDDNQDLAGAVAALAVARGCEGIAANSAPEALEILRQRRVDLMILDYHMPGMSGLELLQSLKECHSVPAVPPVVVCSADEDAEEPALALGAVEFVGKDRNVWQRLADVLHRYAGCDKHPC